MKKIANAGLVTILVTALAFAGGCATTGSTGNDATRTKAEGTGGGAVIGSVLGGLIGYVIGKKRGAVIGGVLGGLLGGVAGYAYGTSVANQKAEYATTEAWLAACLEELKTSNKEIAAYNEGLKTTLASYSSGSGGKTRQQRQAIQKNAQDSQKILTEYKDLRNRHSEVIASTNEDTRTTQQMQAEINEMDKHIQLLEQYNQKLLVMSNRS